MTDDPLQAFGTIPPELRLLLHCLRLSEPGSRPEAMPFLIDQGFDWEGFLQLVDRHRVPAQVYTSLSEIESPGLKPVQLEQLRQRARFNTQRGLAMAGELLRILQHFRSEGLQVLPLKGPVLALQAYGDFGQRHVGDLDLLVPPEHVQTAEQGLMQLGYQRSHPDFQLSPKQQTHYVRIQHHFGYWNPQGKLRVELHWRFGSNPLLFPLDFSSLWDQRQTLRIGGTELQTLSIRHTFFLLCVHGAMHGWLRLFWLLDIARLLNTQQSFDWTATMPQAKDLGIESMVLEAVVLANLICGFPPSSQLQGMQTKSARVDRLLDMALLLITSPESMRSRPFSQAYRAAKWHEFSLRKERGYRLSFCRKQLAPPWVEWTKYPLPDALFPLYYFIRPLTWLQRMYARNHSRKR